jgi:protoporphyrinogen oxidase
MPTGFTKNVVVMGGGISGLGCAFRLRQLGADVTVLEASERPGGVISTIRRNGFLFEGGPQFPRFPASIWQLVHDLDLEKEFVPGGSRAKRYILKCKTVASRTVLAEGTVVHAIGWRSFEAATVRRGVPTFVASTKSRSPRSYSENLTKIFRVVSGRLWPADGHTREE